MKTLGLIGGTTWLSTIDYYRVINQLVNERLGGSHSAKILLQSLNFEEVKTLIDADDWDGVGRQFSEAAHLLESAGADCIVLCANTAHRVAETVKRGINIPLIHIAEVTAEAISKKKLVTVGLLGTRFTMEQPFFKERLWNHGIANIIPEDDDRIFIHNSIFDELGKSIFRDETKQRYIRIIGDLQRKGAQGIILGCTEIPLIIKQADTPVPVFDTTVIHSTAAVEFALK